MNLDLNMNQQLIVIFEYSHAKVVIIFFLARCSGVSSQFCSAELRNQAQRPILRPQEGDPAGQIEPFQHRSWQESPAGDLEQTGL